MRLNWADFRKTGKLASPAISVTDAACTPQGRSHCQKALSTGNLRWQITC